MHRTNSGLANEPPADPLAAAFGDLADGHEQLVGGLFDDDPDLRIELGPCSAAPS